jgi:hypothetical protein
MPRLTIKYVPLDDIIPAERNPKGHDVDGIRGSMSHFGYMEPVLRDERTGRLVGGHGRVETLAAMRDAGESPPEGVQLRNGRWLVPVTSGWSSRSDADAAAALVALNRYVERGGWEHDGLVELLSELDEELRAIAGYSDGQYAALIALDQPLMPLGDQSGQVPTHFAVIIDCATEAEQAALIDRLLGEGLSCRALM